MPAKRKAVTKQASKKQKVEPVVKTEYDVKLEFLLQTLANTEYPIEGAQSNRQMLIDGAPHCFCEFAGDRHAHQNALADMIHEALTGIRKHLQGKVDEQVAIQTSGDATRAGLVTASETAATELAAKTEAHNLATEELAVKKTLTKEAQDVLKQAKAEQKDLDAQLDLLKDEAESFRKGQEDLYAPLLANGPDKKMLKELTPILAHLNLEGQFQQEITTTLSKAMDQRGMFDTIASDHVQGAFTKRRESIAAKITEITTGGASIIENTQAKLALVNEALMAQEGASERLQLAKDAMKEAEKYLKACNVNIQVHDSNVEMSTARREECEAELSNFGVAEETFTWLRTREPAPVVEEKPAEDTEMAEAPTAEATVEGEVTMEAAPEAPVELPEEPVQQIAA